MEKIIVNYKGLKLQKVTLATLKKLLKENGKVEFYSAPCKINIYSPFCGLFKSTVKNIKELTNTIANIEYYNCSSETGKYLHYYISVA